MKQEPNDVLLDEALEAVRRDEPSAEALDAASARVLERLKAAAAVGTAAETASAQAELAKMDTCEEIQAQLPAYVAGTLPEARAMLIEDQVKNCLSCRRALKAIREGRPMDAPAPLEVPEDRTWWRIGAVAAGLLGLLFGGWLFSGGAWPGAQSDLFEVQSIEGQLFHMSDAGQVRLQPGDWIDGREEVRTAKGSRAIVRLADQSLVEINERTSFEVTRRRTGHQIRVRRGDIIVEASEQGSGSLGVSTEECLVSVKGTIFSVSHGAKGSRVSVIEGEVEVNHGRANTALLPGDQLATRAQLASLPFESELSWSQNADEYLAMLEEFRELRQGLNQLMAATTTRYSSSLLDLVPADTSVYVALPNPTATFADAYALLRERVAANPTYYAWMQELDASGIGSSLDELVSHVRELSEYLGDETVVAMAPAVDDFGLPVVLSEVSDPLGFRAALEDKFERLLEEAQIDGDDVPTLAFVDDPSTSVGTDGDLYVWVGPDVMVATPSLAALQQVYAATTGGNPFVGSGFHSALREGYTDGAQFVAGIDFAIIWDEITGNAESEEAMALAMTGFSSARYLIVDRQQDEQRAHTAATLSFDGSRQGMASWLASPAPVASLDFFSPDTTFVGAGLSRDPAELFDEVFGLLLATNEDARSTLDQIEAETGIAVRDDLLASLGGEVAFGVDGPALPTPSWKIALEVYDEGTLQYVIETMVQRANDKMLEEGIQSSVALTSNDVDGVTYYQVNGEVDGIGELGLGAEVHYVYDGGYLIAAPSRALLDRALTIRDSGVNVVTAPEFRELLPTDGYIDFSAVAFNRIGEMVAGVLDRVPMPEGLTPEQEDQAQALISEMTEDAGPSLYLVYGEDDRIRVVSNSPSLTPFEGLGSMFGLGAMFAGSLDAPDAAAASTSANI
ncbi:MAG: FecR domain-containing protein [Acidobacteriota bacterium]